MTFTPLTQPTLIDGALLGSKTIWVPSEPDGSFEVELRRGTYRVTVDGVIVHIYIDDDSTDATLPEVITDDVVIVEGTVTSGANLGWFQVHDIATLRLIPYRSTNKRAWVVAPEAPSPKEWYWSESSTALDDSALSVVKPFDRTNSEPGRWLAA